MKRGESGLFFQKEKTKAKSAAEELVSYQTAANHQGAFFSFSYQPHQFLEYFVATRYAMRAIVLFWFVENVLGA